VRCAREGVFFSEQLASRTILSPLHIHRETPEFRLQELLAQAGHPFNVCVEVFGVIGALASLAEGQMSPTAAAHLCMQHM
jgi:hypothetical protein